MLNSKDKGRLLQIESHCTRIEEIIKTINKKEFKKIRNLRYYWSWVWDNRFRNSVEYR